jgi:protease IV
MDNESPPVPKASPPPLLLPAGPPPLAPLPRSRPARRGLGWMIVALILAVLLVISAMYNFRQFASGFAVRSKMNRPLHHRLEEVTTEHNYSRHKIAVVDVTGIITSEPWDRTGNNLVDLISEQLRLAGDDDAVKAVVLKVDSPGGEVMASDDIARAITEFQNEHNKPVVASMGGLAASGGYYIAVPCQWIVANELTITGSIGVIMHSFNYRGLLDKVGVRPEVFKSGKFKDMLRGSKGPEEVLPEERKMIQALIDETFTKFKKVVADGRRFANKSNKDMGRDLADNWEEYADGRILSGKQAFEYGFVDELGNFDIAVKRAQTLAGIVDANLIQYQQPFNLGNLFRFFGESESRAVTIDLGMQLPKLQVGRLYFLSPTVLY